MTQTFAECLKKFIGVGVDDDVKSPGFKSPDRNGRDVSGADRLGDLSGEQVIEPPVNKESGLAVKEADVDPLPDSGLLPLVERGHHSVGSVKPARPVAHGRP